MDLILNNWMMELLRNFLVVIVLMMGFRQDLDGNRKYAHRASIEAGTSNRENLKVEMMMINKTERKLLRIPADMRPTTAGSICPLTAAADLAIALKMATLRVK